MSSVVHCNLCSVFPSPQCTSFRLSNCGHIFCQGCTDKGRLAVKCNRCNAAAPKCITIDRNLNTSLQMLFTKASAMVAQHMEELSALMKFQSSQRSLRFNAGWKQRQRIVELQSQVTNLLEQVQVLQCEQARASREESRSVRRAGDGSEVSHHQTMSSTGSIDTTAYLDPFNTPKDGLSRFATSTAKVQMLTTKKSQSTKNPCVPRRISVDISPILRDEDDKFFNPAPIRGRSRPTQRQRSNNIMMDSDSLVGAVPRRINDETPAPSKRLSIAERLSAPRDKSTQRVTQQSDVT